MPPLDDVEHALGLDQADRDELPGLYRLNTRRVPLLRLVERREHQKCLHPASLAKSQFLARMSHELRTPLDSVVGFANVLLKKRGAELPSREHDYLVRIRENGVHLLALINDVLDIARIEEGKMVIDRTELDREELVRNTLHQLEGRRPVSPPSSRPSSRRTAATTASSPVPVWGWRSPDPSASSWASISAPRARWPGARPSRSASNHSPRPGPDRLRPADRLNVHPGVGCPCSSDPSRLTPCLVARRMTSPLPHTFNPE